MSNVVVNTTAQTIQVTLTNDSIYTISYPDATLLAQMLATHPELVAVSAKSGSSSWTSLLTLLLPLVSSSASSSS